MAAGRVKLRSIDLNLLVVFDAMMRERNVTRAGKQLGLSQPAMSHALTRLRYMLNDALFVRSPKGMLPTPRAEELAPPLRQALDGLQHALEPATFDPTAKRTFRIAADNYAAIVLVAPIVARVGRDAPGVTLEFLPSGTLDVFDLLDRSQLELAIGSFARQAERFSWQRLLQDSFVALLRKRNRTAAGHEITMEKLAALPHLEISSAHHPTDFVDAALARRQLTREVSVRAPFVSAARILAASDTVCVLPRRMALQLASDRLLVIRPLPHPTPSIETFMIWPRSFDNQPAHRWLRQNIETAIHDFPR
jgi:DNA-binding transcriptional LysR family regulator